MNNKLQSQTKNILNLKTRLDNQENELKNGTFDNTNTDAKI